MTFRELKRITLDTYVKQLDTKLAYVTWKLEITFWKPVKVKTKLNIMRWILEKQMKITRKTD